MSNAQLDWPGQASAASPVSAMRQGVAARLRGPGGLYNLGNMIGFAGGLAAALIAIPHQDFGLSAALAAASGFVWGSPAALALSLATLVFFWSGEQYHRAWANGFPPDEEKLRIGDLSSAVGAVLLAGAFFALGNLMLALTAGAMHAAGKLGSAVGASRAMTGRSFRFTTQCREIVLLSRFPAMVMAVHGLMAGAQPSAMIVSGVLLACCLLWAAADVLLLPHASLLSPRRFV